MKRHLVKMSSADTCTKKRRDLVSIHVTLYEVLFLKT